MHYLWSNSEPYIVTKAECRKSVFYHTKQCLLELSTSKTSNDINMVSLF